MPKIGRWLGYDVYDDPPEQAVLIPLQMVRLVTRARKPLRPVKEIIRTENGQKVQKAFFRLGDKMILATRPKEDK